MFSFFSCKNANTCLVFIRAILIIQGLERSSRILSIVLVAFMQVRQDTQTARSPRAQLCTEVVASLPTARKERTPACRVWEWNMSYVSKLMIALGPVSLR